MAIAIGARTAVRASLLFGYVRRGVVGVAGLILIALRAPLCGLRPLLVGRLVVIVAKGLLATTILVAFGAIAVLLRTLLGLFWLVLENEAPLL